MSNDLPLNRSKKNVSVHVTRLTQCNYRMWSLFCQSLIFWIHKFGLIVFTYLYDWNDRQLEFNTFTCSYYKIYIYILRTILGNKDLYCTFGLNIICLWDRMEVSTSDLSARKKWTSTLQQICLWNYSSKYCLWLKWEESPWFHTSSKDMGFPGIFCITKWKC